MELPSTEEIERSVGGRPKLDNLKVRMSFYLLPDEAVKLRERAKNEGISLSMYVRSIVKKHLK